MVDMKTMRAEPFSFGFEEPIFTALRTDHPFHSFLK